MKLEKKDKQHKTDGITNIHNARFYNLTSRGINCMDYNKISHKLALARNDGSLEIWDMEHAPFQEKSTFRLSLESIIETVVWANKRLFTAGLHGELIEWNTTTMQPLRKQRVTGNSIWCLAVNRKCTELAIGTEEGYINIFDIEHDEFQYKLLFDKQEGRVLCCSFDATGKYLVTGSVEVLRVWNACTGHALRKMTFPKTIDNNDTILWSLCVLQDFSIVVGDSRGFITVYDGHTGAHLEHHQVLKADVLTLNVNETEDMLICSGVEPLIRIYAKTQIKRDDTTYYRWVKYLQRAVHDHDVKALLCIPKDQIISGGVDGYLGISSLTRMRSTISKHGSFLRSPFAAVSGPLNLLLLRYLDYLEVWSLGVTNQNLKEQIVKRSTAKLLPLTSSPSKLLELRSKNFDAIVCSTLSFNGQWLCYATLKETRLFQLIFVKDEKGKQMPHLQRFQNPHLTNTPATNLEFGNDDRILFLLSNTIKHLLIFELVGGDSYELKKTINLEKHIKGTITQFKVSKNDKYFVVADDDHTVAVWRNFEHFLNVPRYETAATVALTLHSNLFRVVIAYADSRIIEYDLDKACFTCWYDHSHLISNAETHCVTEILIDQRNPNIIILQNDGFLYTLEKYIGDDENDKDMMKKLKGGSPNKLKNRQISSLRLKFQKSFEHLVHTCWISDNDLLTVNVNRSILLDKLPTAFRQKKYGTA